MPEAEPSGSPRAAAPAPGTAWAPLLVTISGIPIRLHFTFFLLLVWVAVRTPAPYQWQSVIFMVGIFACVVLHELGHSIVAQRMGIGVSEIVLYPIGGVARMEKLPTARQELWVALAGPAVNVVIAAALFGYLTARGALVPWEFASVNHGFWLQKIALANVVLATFNMVPAFPMDGGRVLRALLGLRLGEVRATEIASNIGQLLAIVAGIFALLNGNAMLLFIAFFVFIGAGQEANLYRGKALVKGLAVSNAMITDFRVLPVGATLRDAADLLLQTSQQDFPVLHGEEVVGILSRQSLLRGLAEHGPSEYVTGTMSREVTEVRPDQELEEIASEMQTGRTPCVLVTADGKLLGMVTMENLAELLVVRQLLNREPSAR